MKKVAIIIVGLGLLLIVFLNDNNDSTPSSRAPEELTQFTWHESHASAYSFGSSSQMTFFNADDDQGRFKKKSAFFSISVQKDVEYEGTVLFEDDKFTIYVVRAIESYPTGITHEYTLENYQNGKYAGQSIGRWFKPTTYEWRTQEEDNGKTYLHISDIESKKAQRYEGTAL